MFIDILLVQDMLHIYFSLGKVLNRGDEFVSWFVVHMGTGDWEMSRK